MLKSSAGLGTKTVLALIFAALAFFIHSFVIFNIFSPAQFVKYPVAAREYLNGHLSNERMIDYSPFYLTLNIFLEKFFSDPSRFLEWLNIAVMAVCSALLFFILAEFFSVSVSCAGTLVFVLNSQILVYEQTLEPESFVLFFLLLWLFFATRRQWLWHGLGGICFGIGIWTRPNLLPALVFVPIHFYFQQGGAEIRAHRRSWLTSSLLFCLPAIAFLVGFWIRNERILGYFSPVAMNPGTVIYEGNNPNSGGFSVIYPALVDEIALQHSGESDYQHQINRDFARKIVGKALTIPEVNAYWLGKIRNFIHDEPRHFVKLIAFKIFHFFHQYQWHDLPNPYWNQQKLAASSIPMIPFGMISGLCLIGLWIERSRAKATILLYGVFLSQFLIMLATYITSRQRVTVVPVFIFFACAAIAYFVKSRMNAVVVAIVFVLLCVPLSIETDMMKEETHLWRHSEASNSLLTDAYRKRHDRRFSDAARFSAFSLAAAPWLADSRRPANLSFEPDGFQATALKLAKPVNFSSLFDVATLSIEAGRNDDAEKILRTIVQGDYRLKRDYYECSEPEFYLARIRLSQGKQEEAIEMLQKTLNRSPGNPWILAELYAITGQERFRDKLFRYFDDIDAHYYLGKALLRSRQAQKAAESFSYVVSKCPEYRPGYFYLAAALSQSGLLQEAAAHYRQAIKIRPDPVMLEKEICELFRRLAESEPANLFAQYSYGVVLRQFGHYAEALKIQKKALTRDPSNHQIKQEIEGLELISRER